MLEAALLNLNRIPGDALRLRLGLVALEIRDANAVLRHDGNFPVIQKENVARVLKDRGNVRRHKELVVAEADNNRRALARGNDRVRLVSRND